MDYSDRITLDPSICHGKPCIRGLRYPVESVLLAEIGSTAAALPVLQRAIAAQQQLVRKAPARVAYRRDLAVSYNNLGRVLLDGGDLPGSVNRSYYAMFYAVLALLAREGTGTSKHTGAVGLRSPLRGLCRL